MHVPLKLCFLLLSRDLLAELELSQRFKRETDYKVLELICALQESGRLTEVSSFSFLRKLNHLESGLDGCSFVNFQRTL